MAKSDPAPTAPRAADHAHSLTLELSALRRNQVRIARQVLERAGQRQRATLQRDGPNTTPAGPMTQLAAARESANTTSQSKHFSTRRVHALPISRPSRRKPST
jgi:hypothetical protein